MRNIRIYIKDISEAMKAAQLFVEGMDFETFIVDDKTSSAVLTKLGIINEATKRVPDTIRQKYPEMPWGEMTGMENNIMHQYFAVDYAIVWDTVKNRIREAQPLIERILEEMDT